MSDLFLSDLQVAERTFSLSAPLAPTSIRDQIVRAQLAVQRLRQENLILPAHECLGRPPRLVVIGAGVTGVATALEAVAYGVATTVVDDSTDPLRAQAFCNTRWLDPTEYDWPAPHWQGGRYPCHVMMRASPLRWDRPATASQLALAWSQRYKTIMRQSPSLLTHMPNHRLIGVKRRRGSFVGSRVIDTVFSRRGGRNCNVVVAQTKAISLNDNGCPVVNGSGGPVYSGPICGLEASAILVCVGIGKEKCEIGPGHLSRGPHFWDSDHLSDSDYGIDNRKPRILISGAGDGGLQDFIRVLVKPDFARRGVGGILNYCVPSTKLPLELWAIQESVSRLLTWGRNHWYLAALEREYLAVIDDTLEDKDVRGRIKDILRHPTPDVRLVYPCTHFPPVFALNRFVAMLIARYCKTYRKDMSPLLLPGHKLASLTGVGPHVCRGSASECYGTIARSVEHTFTLEQKVCVAGTHVPAVPRGRESGVVDLVVIRHGVDQSRLPQSLKGLLYRKTVRQTLPVGLPD